MLESVAAGPWIYTAVVVSVLLDVFLPVLPSGILVITAATVAATGNGSLLALTLCAAGASVLGDLVAYRLAWRGRSRLHRLIARSRRLTVAQERLGAALARGGGVLVVIARFAPAGRSVVSLGAGAARRRASQFVPWSALAGVAWASYSVALGYFGSQWLGPTWTGVAVSAAALLLAGALAAYVIRRPTGGAEQPLPGAAVPDPEPGAGATRADIPAQSQGQPLPMPQSVPTAGPGQATTSPVVPAPVVPAPVVPTAVVPSPSAAS
ncbi:DedA family protein [Streptomyces ficellus]|uniref:DedA family protein n=1 Tax=Streptomyces ficellus TaxID=1977088 RepID=UPI001FCBD561|nr:VTT domain-containing protein [Streptomyces ficellus]